MARNLPIRQPRSAEVRQLDNLVAASLNAKQRRRAEAILLYAAGLNGLEIAEVLQAHPDTIYTDLHAFERYGPSAVAHLGSGGAVRRMSETHVAEMLHLAEVPPYELGLPYGRWSLSTLRDYLLKPRIAKAISREHRRRLLKKGGSGFAASSARSSARIRNGGPF